ncbi:MAG: S1/P1 nuclease [Bryobacteraceae bacterium]
MRIRSLGALLAALVVVPCALAWNGTGHRAIARIAYENLQSTPRARVDALLKRHPDYAAWVRGIPESEAGQAAFERASKWPDDIRGDRRLDNPGWHYINLPFSTDGTDVSRFAPLPPNALTKLQDIRKSLGNPSVSPESQTHLLPWLIHLVGDVHNPLHTTARFLKTQPRGDRGGNAVIVRGAGNLHSYWDGLLGRGETPKFLAKLVETIIHSHPKPANPDLRERQWVQEGLALCRKFVYSFGEGGTRENPVRLSDEYRVKARRIAHERAATAGYRLAAVLNERFR